MQKLIWVVVFSAALIIAGVAGYFLFSEPDQEVVEVEPNPKTVEIVNQLESLKDNQPQDDLANNEEEPSIAVTDLTGLEPIAFESEKDTIKASEPKKSHLPDDLTIYTADGATSKHAYTISRFDEDGKKVDEIKVLEEQYLSNGNIAVTLELASGEIQQERRAVINGAKRGYAIDLDGWQYAEVPFVELEVMFDKGDKAAGFQLGHLLLLQGKVEQAVPYLVASAEKTGFSRPIDLIAHYELSQNNLIEAAAWGQIATKLSGINEINSKVQKNLSDEDSVLIESRVEQLLQQYQLQW